MEHPIRNQYIYLIADDAVETAQQIALEMAVSKTATVLAVWEEVPKGFALEFLEFQPPAGVDPVIASPFRAASYDADFGVFRFGPGRRLAFEVVR